jgi:hypothetical protein
MKMIIKNWNKLTKKQKIQAEKNLKDIEKKNVFLNEPIVPETAIYFEKNKWLKIDKFIDSNMATLLYSHIILEAKKLIYLTKNFNKELNCNEIFKNIYGTFEDPQALGDFSNYGDNIFDALLSISTEKISKIIKKDLMPTYSYHRLYTTGTELKKHIDRESCEISITLCLGYDISNIDSKKYPDWDWPMFIKELNGNVIPVHMKPGDMIIYRGCELEHWREPFWGKNHAQVFLHYKEKNKKNNIAFDGRPELGLSQGFRNIIN